MGEITKIKVNGDPESSYQLYPRNEEFAKRSGGNTGSQSGVQSDWNQNDDTQPDYVKNRPFYTSDPVETVLVEESTELFSNVGSFYAAIVQSTFEATVGEIYKISWDSTVYECACVDFSGNTIIGNLSIMGYGSDTGEPFIMSVSESGINIFTADTSDTHTFSIIGKQAPIVKIPAKFIDKDASGYIAIHKNSTMTKQEAQNYRNSISAGKVVFIIWGDLCIKEISFGSSQSTGDYISLRTQNYEIYKISSNDGYLYEYEDRVFSSMTLPSNWASGDNPIHTYNYANRIVISPVKFNAYVGTTDELFRVQPNGTKSKAFSVLGNGEAVAPAIILYSSTADSTKKFKITVDDSGALTATEVT